MKKYLILVFIFLNYSWNSLCQATLKPSQFFNFRKSIEVPKNAFANIYIVPKDTFLVLTDFFLETRFSSSYIYKNSEKLIELSKGQWFHSSTGLLLNPRDTVKIYNEDLVDNNFRWHIIGYKISK